MTKFDDKNENAYLFEGYCGHEWVGSNAGFYECPVCGEHDGDHNLKTARQIAIQLEDFGTLWHLINLQADKVLERTIKYGDPDFGNDNNLN